MEVGDLVMWMGKPTEYSQFHRRVVYQVIEKEPAKESTYSSNNYRLRVAFDFENPMGTDMNSVSHLGTRDFKRLALLDVGVLRLLFDNFIREWSASQNDVVPSVGPDDVA